MTTVHNQIHDTRKRINHRRRAIHLEKAQWFNVGDWVLVDRRNLQVKAGDNRSLTNKWIGPFRVTAAKGTHAYKLEVPGERDGTTLCTPPCWNHSEIEQNHKNWMRMRKTSMRLNRLSTLGKFEARFNTECVGSVITRWKIPGKSLRLWTTDQLSWGNTVKRSRGNLVTNEMSEATFRSFKASKDAV